MNFKELQKIIVTSPLQVYFNKSGMSFGGQVYNREAKDPSTMGCVWVCEKGTSQTL